MSAKENVGMLAGFLVRHAFPIRDLTHQLTRIELALQVFPRSAENNQHFWRRIAIAAVPKGIYGPNRGRQSEPRPVKLPCARLAIIPGEDSYSRAILRRQHIPD